MLNHEQKTSYAFNVVASEPGDAPLTATRAVTLAVTDVAESLTVSGLADASVAENAAWTSPTPATVGHTGAVTWSKSGDDAADFTITSGTGVLKMVGRDHEDPQDADEDNAYEVTVTATDEDGIEGEVSITVTVTNVNEAPAFASAATLALSVPEGTTGDIGSPVVATDPEGATLTYSLTGTDAAAFEISEFTGQLSVARKVTLDASAKASYSFTVVASDGARAASRAVSVGVVEPESPGSVPRAGAPAAPSDLEASLLTSEVVVLTWRDNAEDETGFEVYAREDTGGWESLRSLPADRETATIEELSAGIEYEFVVTASNLQGEAASDVASVELSLAPPTHLDAAAVSVTSARIAWRDNSVVEAGFKVQLRPVDAGGSNDGEVARDGEGRPGVTPDWRVVASVGPDVTSTLVEDLEPGGKYRFRVGALGRETNAFSGAGTFTLADPPAAGELTDCEPGGNVVTLSGGYDVRMCYETPSGARLDASNYHLESTASGLLHFFDRDNVEVLVKVLDGCAINGHKWVFIAPVTTLAYNLEIVERITGRRFARSNPGGVTAQTVSDTMALPCDPESPETASAAAVPESPDAASDDDAPPVCEPEGPGVVLKDGHRIDMCFATPDGEIGQARDWGLARRSSSLLYFFDRDNVEVLVKVLDGCAVNGHRWVFAAAATDLAFHLVVTSPDGERWTHRNDAGRAAGARSETAAFMCR